MMRNALQQARTIHDIIARRLQNAEMALGASLMRLSALDAAIAALCVERAQIVQGMDEASTFAAIEARRRAAGLRIERMKEDRSEVEAAIDQQRRDTARLLRRKIALEGAMAPLVDEQRRRNARAR